MIINEKSVRVDLLGGTLDIWPLNIIIPNVVTINLATSLKVKVEIGKSTYEGIEILAKDYNTSVSQIPSSELTTDNIYIKRKFEHLTFIVQLLDYFNIKKNIKITTSSAIPAGSGLGASSALGMAIFSALCEYTTTSTSITQDKKLQIKIVQDIEANALNMGPTGYQDYFPALYGGILALKAQPGDIIIEQLYNKELKEYLESHITLIYSGGTRYSALNNWDVFKSFFDKKEKNTSSTSKFLHEIASCSYEGFQAIKSKDYEKLKDSIIKEGEVRSKLCPNILTPQMTQLLQTLKKYMKQSKQNKQNEKIGIKVCGAGGGGCFLLVHDKIDKQLLIEKIKESSMEKIGF